MKLCLFFLAHFVLQQGSLCESATCPEHWDLFKGNCFYVSSLKSSWDEAREFCKWKDSRADLLTVHSEKEQKFIKGKMFWNLWIGLMKQNANAWQWSDGSPQDFSFWSRYPIGQKFNRCAYISIDSKWKDRKCRSRMRFACKVKGDFASCPEGWEHFLDSCYYVSKKPAKWHQARNWCKKMEVKSDLASIHSLEEQEFLTEQQFWNVWLGIQVSGNEENWKWIDSSVRDLDNWGVGEPNLRKGSCAILPYSLTWSSERCESLHRFVCKAPATPCPKGWLLEENSCWNFIKAAAPWTKAEEYCQKLDTRAHLPSIHSLKEEDIASRFLTNRLWMGLARNESHDWHWTNKLSLNWTNWADGQPMHYKDSSCGVLDKSKKWFSVPCDSQNNFACELFVGHESCPSGWESFREACFYISDYQTSWRAAREVCQQMDPFADLVAVPTINNQETLLEQMVHRSWIGLHKLQDAWDWIDNSPVDFWSNWQHDMEKVVNDTGEDSQQCITYDVDNSRLRWKGQNCSENLPFLCKFSVGLKYSSYSMNFLKLTNGIMCPPVHAEKGSSVQCSNSNGLSIPCNQWHQKGSIASFRCQDFWEVTSGLEGTRVTCEEDGDWSHTKLPKCKPVCGSNEGVKEMNTHTLFIYNGMKVLRGQWSWHAGIYRKLNLQWLHSCGGTLITERVVLTAAHCITLNGNSTEVVKPSALKVFLGKYYSSYDKNDEFVQEKNVKRIVRHSLYDPLDSKADIALLILEGPVNFTHYVQLACLPQQNSPALQPGRHGTVVGWGRNENEEIPSELYMAELSLVDLQECKRVVKYEIPSKMFCAGFKNTTNVCNGDSGGGMFFPSLSANGMAVGHWTVEGITSFGFSHNNYTCIPQLYSVYTQVREYLDWIKGMLAPTQTSISSDDSVIVPDGMEGEEEAEEICPEGWIKWSSSCYKFENVSFKNWWKAKRACEDANGHLAIVNSRKEKGWLASQIPNFELRGGWSRWWIGLQDVAGKWQWLDGSPSEGRIVQWYSEDQKSPPPGDCVELVVASMMSNEPCDTYNQEWICQKQQSGAKCPDDWHGFPPNCYWLSYEERTTWDLAREFCLEMGADLPTISTEEERMAILQMLGENLTSRQSYRWVGLSRKTDAFWRWMDGQGVMLDNRIIPWQISQPDNLNENKNCGLFKFQELLLPTYCQKARNYLCEKKVEVRKIKKRQRTWEAGVFLQSNEFEPKFLCSGTVLSNASVLTASSCVKEHTPHSLFVAVEAHQENSQDLFSQMIRVSTVEKMDGLAVLLLEENMKAVFYTNAVMSRREPEEGEKGVMIGWKGESNIKSYSLAVTAECCSNFHLELGISCRLLCGKNEQEEELCPGFVGSGWMSKENGRWVLQAVAIGLWDAENGLEWRKCRKDKKFVLLPVASLASWMEQVRNTTKI